MSEIPPEVLAAAAGSDRCGCRAYDPVHNDHTEAGHTDCHGPSSGTPCGGCDSCISAQVWYWERRRAAICEYCNGTGMDGAVIAIDPYPVVSPYPCGWCEGTGRQDVDPRIAASAPPEETTP